MQFLAIFASFFAAVAANGHLGHMGIMGPNMGAHFGQMMNHGMYTGMYGNHGNNNMLHQLLHSHMGQQNMNNMYGNMNGQMYGHKPHQQQQTGMTNNILGSLLGNMLGSVMMSNLRGPMGGWQQPQATPLESAELARMQELLKMSMATELFDVMRAYDDFKDKEEEFGEAMYYMCIMVNATWSASRQYNFQVFNKTTDESVEQMERDAMGMTEEEKLQGIVTLLMTDSQTFEELFFRMATWSCWAGKEYMDAALKLEKMNRGEKYY